MALNYHDHFIGLGDQFDPFSRDVTSFPENGYSLMEVLVLEEEGAETRQRYVIISVEGIVNMGVIVNSFMQSMSDFNLTEFIEDQAAFSPGSLEKLEFEITEILKSRRGNPIWIASLPMIYYELYGRTLQAEGYLTESQTHGKAGYSLSRLLARLRNSIRLINRPHGQHAVVLAEDASRYMENRYERNSTSPGPIVSGSKQIYLTFPAESTFSEDDVADYFGTFGPVQDVRIPCQQKRMFGFVTFHNYETVQMVLSKGNPHYVCGARVLVKPYREKCKLFDRKYFEKLEGPVCDHSQHMDMDQDFQARLEPSRMFGRQLVDEHELAIQLEMMRLSQLQLTRGPSYLENTFDDQKVSEDQADNSKFQSPKHITHLLDHTDINYAGQDNESNEGLDLPDSPFASKCS